MCIHDSDRLVEPCDFGYIKTHLFFLSSLPFTLTKRPKWDMLEQYEGLRVLIFTLYFGLTRIILLIKIISILASSSIKYISKKTIGNFKLFFH
jgi:hypothetical protein